MQCSFSLEDMTCQSYRKYRTDRDDWEDTAAELPTHAAAGVVCKDSARSTGSFAIADKSRSLVLLVAVVIASRSLSFVLPFASRTHALCVFDSHHPALRKLNTADCGLSLYKGQCQR